MKKKFWIILALLVVLIIGIISYNKYHAYVTSSKYLLEKKGYTEKQINDIISNKDIVSTLLEKDYNEYIIDIMTSKYYLAKNLDKYLEYKAKYKDKDNKDVIAIINVGANVDWYSKSKEADTSKGNLMLVNKFNYLNQDYQIDDLVDMSLTYAFNGKQVRKEVNDNFKALANTAKKENLTILANSTYRTYAYQEKTYNSVKSSNGKTYADKFAARPGFSEHQTGLAIDVSTKHSTMENFKDSEEYKWLQDHAHEYGFILRYPEGKEYLTGYSYESWHYRYVGIKAATQIKNEGITFDEYYAYYVE